MKKDFAESLDLVKKGYMIDRSARKRVSFCYDTDLDKVLDFFKTQELNTWLSPEGCTNEIGFYLAKERWPQKPRQVVFDLRSQSLKE